MYGACCKWRRGRGMGRRLFGDVLSVRGVERGRRCVSRRDCAQGALGLSEHVVGYEPESRKGGAVKTLFITRERTKLGSGSRRPAPCDKLRRWSLVRRGRRPPSCSLRRRLPRWPETPVLGNPWIVILPEVAFPQLCDLQLRSRMIRIVAPAHAAPPPLHAANREYVPEQPPPHPPTTPPLEASST